MGFAKSGDVLLTHKGSVGNSAIVPEVEDYVMLSPQVTYYRVNPEKIDRKYLMYAFQHPWFQDIFESIANQSTRPYIGITDQRNLEIPWHSLGQQRRIGKILSSFDNLIRNNKRRIEILEEVAETLYRRWFVNFNFPSSEDVEMKDSELGKIPKCFSVEEVGEIVERLSRPKKYNKDEVREEGEVQVVGQSEDYLMGFHSGKPEYKPSPENPLITFGDHTCKTRLMVEPFSIGPNVIPYKSSTNHPEIFLYFLTKDLIQTQEYKRHWTDFKRKEVVVPKISLAKIFSQLTSPFYELIKHFHKRNRNISKIRDLLLPRLISGEVEV